MFLLQQKVGKLDISLRKQTMGQQSTFGKRPETKYHLPHLTDKLSPLFLIFQNNTFFNSAFRVFKILSSTTGSHQDTVAYDQQILIADMSQINLGNFYLLNLLGCVLLSMKSALKLEEQK